MKIEEKKKQKEKKKRSAGSLRNTILLSLLIVMVAGIGVYGWFSVSNKARVEKLSLIADHQGNLQIADDTGNGPGIYSSVLDLKDTLNTILSPVTSKDGVKFFAPNYDTRTGAVTSVTELTEHTELTKHYIYEKTFYLKAGAEKKSTVANIARTYDVALYGLSSNNKEEGCNIYQSDGKNETAANAIRISFTLDDGTTCVYEPNSNVHNNDNRRAVNGIDNAYGTFTKLYQQKSDGTFVVSPKVNESEKLFNIKEDVDVKVTMRIWLEGTDDDCTNSIESDSIVGQIQFISTEIKSK